MDSRGVHSCYFAINITDKLCYNIEMMKDTEPVIFAEHFGFCEGVSAANKLLRDVTDWAKKLEFDNVYCLHDIVHNREVVQKHEANGVKFVDNLEDIPDYGVVVTSAHGVGPEVKYELDQKNALVFEAACPKVLHAQQAVQKAREAGEQVIYICKGKPGYVDKLHDEVLGIVGHLDYSYTDGVLFSDALERSYIELTDDPSESIMLNDSGKYRIVTQTTLEAERCLEFREEIANYIRSRQPNAEVNESIAGDVCRAVSDRQKGVLQLVTMNPDRLVVATDPKSKNGMGYVKMARKLIEITGQNTEVFDIATAEQAERLGKIDGITALTASASTADETTFAIAKALGVEEIPDIDRKAFKLKDGQKADIAERLFRHAKAARMMGRL